MLGVLKIALYKIEQKDKLLTTAKRNYFRILDNEFSHYFYCGRKCKQFKITTLARKSVQSSFYKRTLPFSCLYLYRWLTCTQKKWGGNYTVNASVETN